MCKRPISVEVRQASEDFTAVLWGLVLSSRGTPKMSGTASSSSRNGTPSYGTSTIGSVLSDGRSSGLTVASSSSSGSLDLSGQAQGTARSSSTMGNSPTSLRCQSTSSGRRTTASTSGTAGLLRNGRWNDTQSSGVDIPTAGNHPVGSATQGSSMATDSDAELRGWALCGRSTRSLTRGCAGVVCGSLTRSRSCTSNGSPAKTSSDLSNYGGCWSLSSERFSETPGKAAGKHGRSRYVGLTPTTWRLSGSTDGSLRCCSCSYSRDSDRCGSRTGGLRWASSPRCLLIPPYQDDQHT